MKGGCTSANATERLRHTSPKTTRLFSTARMFAQTRESQRIYITTYYSTPYISKRTFNPPHSTFHVAVRHVSHPGTCLTARRKTPDRGEDGHLSQRDTWPIATRSSVWPAAIAQKRDFQSLVCKKTRHNFLTKKHNKARCADFHPNIHWQ